VETGPSSTKIMALLLSDLTCLACLRWVDGGPGHCPKHLATTTPGGDVGSHPSAIRSLRRRDGTKLRFGLEFQRRRSAIWIGSPSVGSTLGVTHPIRIGPQQWKQAACAPDARDASVPCARVPQPESGVVAAGKRPQPAKETLRKARHGTKPPPDMMRTHA
jgi:hypothetical protein